MKTLTFYSYKGGVGRSLALSNMATRLSEFNKKVCVLDFDLEAPGLHFKFSNYLRKITIEKGLVDYIYSFAHGKVLLPDIKDFAITLDPGNKIFQPIHFIPAGNIDSPEYWKKLSMINWADMFYSNDPQGVRFILDLKAKIARDFAPDFLLIDSRTGLNDIAMITLRLMADDIVMLAANNDENIFGSKKIIKSIIDPANALFGANPKVHFVLTRLPFTDTPQDKEREYAVVEKRRSQLKQYLSLDSFEMLVIHTDRSLEIDEKQMIGDIIDENKVSISNDYLKLFDKITEGLLTDDEVKAFKNKKLAEKEFTKAVTEKNESLKLEYLNKAIELDKTNFNFYAQRGSVFYDQKKYDAALNEFLRALELNPDNGFIFYNIGISYRGIKKHEKALEYYNKALEIFTNYSVFLYNKANVLQELGRYDEALDVYNKLIEITPEDSYAFNGRADLFRSMSQLEEAILDIRKAIEINPNEGLYFATLAEIFEEDGKIEDFYFNLTIALSKGLKAEAMQTAKDVYKKFRKEERFINLLNKYEIDIDDVFGEEGKP